MNNNTTRFEIIKCHGSGNDFIMVDTTTDKALNNVDWEAFARIACHREQGIGSDGVLLLVRHDDGVFGMDMLNPDGTHAEMCGNGIRCVARLATERGYLENGEGTLRSGGKDYRVATAEPISSGIEAFAADIPIRCWSNDFSFYAPDESFAGKPIEKLDDKLSFTALNLGNPHITAHVDKIDMELLRSLGERVTRLPELFPHGVNVSLYEWRAKNEIFVATYERGAGITLSCGTAMTASATASTLLGIVDKGARVKVRNRGGQVFCTTTISDNRIVTRLEGNATFVWSGRAEFGAHHFSYQIVNHTDEDHRWQAFVNSLNH